MLLLFALLTYFQVWCILFLLGYFTLFDSRKKVLSMVRSQDNLTIVAYDRLVVSLTGSTAVKGYIVFLLTFILERIYYHLSGGFGLMLSDL